MQLTMIGQYQLISGRVQGTSQAGVQSPDKASFQSILDRSDKPLDKPLVPLAGGPLDPNGPNAAALAADDGNAAALAGGKVAYAAFQRWVEDSLRRTSSDLSSKLSDDDRAQLQAMVDANRISWPEINAALDARIKLATTEQLNRQSGQLNVMPPAWQASADGWAAYNGWGRTMMEERSEIWKKAFAQLEGEELKNFPDPTGESDPLLREKLMAKSNFRSAIYDAADRAIADLEQRMGTQPSRPSTFPTESPYGRALWDSRVTPADTAAMAKLTQAGFVSSPSVDIAINGLADEIATNIANAHTMPAFGWG